MKGKWKPAATHSPFLSRVWYRNAIPRTVKAERKQRFITVIPLYTYCSSGSIHKTPALSSGSFNQLKSYILHCHYKPLPPLNRCFFFKHAWAILKCKNQIDSLNVKVMNITITESYKPNFLTWFISNVRETKHTFGNKQTQWVNKSLVKFKDNLIFKIVLRLQITTQHQVPWTCLRKTENI